MNESEQARNVVWKPNPGGQEEFCSSTADYVLFGGSRGPGKGLRKSEPVLTPFGWKELGKLRVGSKICATDGSVQEIIGYYERGIQPLYKLTWSDGSETVCDEDHIWLSWTSNKTRKINNKRVSGIDSVQKRTTKEILSCFNRGLKVVIPIMTEPCLFNVHGENTGRNKHISRKLHPYILGVLLGDGCISKDVLFSSADPEIPERVEKLLNEGATRIPAVLSKHDYKGKCPSYRIPNEYAKQDLVDLGLIGTKSDTKFIPRIYLLATPEERWDLMQGLMDTDGWVDKDGTCYFTTVSNELALNVRHLARSLGAYVTIKEKKPTYTYKGEKRQGRLAYNLRIKMLNSGKMFSLVRKWVLCKDKFPQSLGNKLVNIESFGTDNTICIAVSNPNNLFIIEDFVVTHNTDALIAEALRYGHIPEYKCLFLRRTFPQLSEVIERTHKLYPQLGWTWKGEPRMWKHPSGAFIQFGHVQREVDKYNYIGKEFQRILYDQVERFTQTQFEEINTTLRTTTKKIPTQVLASANPGGIGHVWVKQKWIDRCPSEKRGEKIWNEDFKMHWQPVKGGKPFIDEFGESWEFHPALVFDNPQLMENDPKYVRKLLALPYESREAYLWGNWAVFVGQYFSEFRQDVHVLTMKQVPKIPSTWRKVGGCDYASSGWYFSGVAVMNHHKEIIFVEEDYFRGGSIRKKARRADRLIDKYPGMEKWVAPWDMYNKMRDRETDQSQGVIIDLFKKHMKKEISIVKAPKDRIGRWDLMRDGFSWSDGDKPWLYIRENCPKLIETIPAMIHKESDPEDLDPDGWTHGVDFMGYVLECMRREGIEPPLDAYDQESKRQSESKIISQYNWLEQ